MMPGAVFSVTESPSSYIRTSFAYADDKDIVEGFRYAVLHAPPRGGSAPIPNTWPSCVRGSLAVWASWCASAPPPVLARPSRTGPTDDNCCRYCCTHRPSNFDLMAPHRRLWPARCWRL